MFRQYSENFKTCVPESSPLILSGQSGCNGASTFTSIDMTESVRYTARVGKYLSHIANGIMSK